MKTQAIALHGANLITAMDESSGVTYVAMKPLVTAMGLDWNTQRQKILKDSRYGHMPIPYKTEGGVQEMICLNTDHLPAFLYSINPNKVRKGKRDLIIAFQTETFGVINAYWREKMHQYSQHNITPQVVNGYKSQIVQHNKKIDNLKAERDYYHKAYEKEISKTVLLVAQKMAQEKGVEHTLLLPTPPKQDKDLEYIQKENLKLKRDLVDIHDRYHQMVSILERTSGIDFIRDELKKLTNSFQRIRSCDESGRPLEHKNLNTDTQAGHKYWDNPY